MLSIKTRNRSTTVLRQTGLFYYWTNVFISNLTLQVSHQAFFTTCLRKKMWCSLFAPEAFKFLRNFKAAWVRLSRFVVTIKLIRYYSDPFFATRLKKFDWDICVFHFFCSIKSAGIENIQVNQLFLNKLLSNLMQYLQINLLFYF